MPNVGPLELLVILIIALLVFGPKKLPEIGKGIGSAMREFRKASRDLMSHFEVDDYEPPRTYPSATVATAADPAPVMDEPAPVTEEWKPETEEPAPVVPPAPVLATAPSNTHPTA
jgi:sec-independent protein translocase protein TatA